MGVSLLKYINPKLIVQILNGEIYLEEYWTKIADIVFIFSLKGREYIRQQDDQ